MRYRAGGLIVVLVLGCGAPALARRPAACPAGRFLKTAPDAPLLPGVTGSLDGVALLAATSVSLDGCGAATRARVTGRRLTARWRRCGPFARVRIAARMQDCDTMAGTIRGAGLKKTRFSATRSACGDHRVDAAGGEACDTLDTCGGDAHCVACACLAVTGTCATTAVPTAAASHVPVGTPITWADDPPASGASYPDWARYLAYSEVIPRAYWVHDLENGGIVLLHAHDADFAAVQALHAAYDAIPVDAACGHRRALLTPDPLLSGEPFAAVAWGAVMRCDLVDPAALVDFVATHRGGGPAPTCADGTYP